MVTCCELFGVRSFVLKVRPWSGNNVPINLHQTSAIHCYKEGQCHKAKLSLSEVALLAERRQRSVGSALSTRSRDPAQLLSLKEPGAQDPAGPQAPQATHTAGAGPSDCVSGRRPLPLGHRGRDWKEIHHHLKA